MTDEWLRNPTIHAEYLDDQETQLLVLVGDQDRSHESYVNLRADRGDKTAEVDFSADVFQDVNLDLWGCVKEHVEGHLEATLPHPEVTASWGKADDQVRRAFLPFVDDFSEQIGWCM